MKVIHDGRSFPRQIKCVNCGSTLEIEEKDVIVKREIDPRNGISYEGRVTCPLCRASSYVNVRKHK